FAPSHHKLSQRVTIFGRPGEPARPTPPVEQPTRTQGVSVPASAADLRINTRSTSAYRPSESMDRLSRSLPTRPGRTGSSLRTMGTGSASTTTPPAAPAAGTVIDAPGAALRATGTSSAPRPPIGLERTLGPTPLLADGWAIALQKWNLERRYPSIVAGIRQGFDVGLPFIHQTFTPNNHKSATNDTATVLAKISKELAAGRYAGPFSREECIAYLGGACPNFSCVTRA
ncbi:hypothetical protein CF326_g9880, partial [Tilletia indica]